MTNHHQTTTKRMVWVKFKKIKLAWLYIAVKHTRLFEIGILI